MNFFSTSCLVVAFLSLALGILVYTRNKKGFINKTWLGVTTSTFLWSVGFFMVVISGNSESAIIGQYVLDSGAIFIPAFWLHFVFILLQDKDGQKKCNVPCLVSYVIAAVLFVISFSPIFKTGMGPMLGFDFWVIPGKIYFLFPLFFIIVVLYSIYLLTIGYKKFSGFRKSQIKYVIIAAFVGFGGGATNFLPQLIDVYPFGQYFMAFYIVFITYAITRYRLMDIKHLVKRSSIFAALVLVIAVLFIILSRGIATALEVAFKVEYPLLNTIVVAVIIASIFRPLERWLGKLTDRFLFTKTYDPSKLISRVSHAISSTIELNKLLPGIDTELGSAFHYNKSAIILLDQKGTLNINHQVGFDADILTAFTTGKEKALPVYFSDNKEIKVIDELKARYEAGEYQPKDKSLLFGLYDLDIALIAPLMVKSKIIGVIVLGNKLSGDPYSDEDLRVLDIIAGQAAIAIENSKLYEEQKNFNVYLKKEVKRATAELEAANKELKRLDDAKSEFISIASHQLRTPLTIVRGYISMILEGSFGKVPEKLKENLVKVMTASERLISLVESLLNISRIESGRLEFNIEPVDLVKISSDLVEEFQQKAGDKKIKLAFYPEKNIPLVGADKNKIKEVISNFVDNAVKYTPRGEVIVGVHQEGSSVVFTCQDTGIGIKPEDLPRLFNKFVRGEGMMQVYTEGTGLGLYVARMMIENMGGRIWAESDGKGKGSKFSFSLPLADKKKAVKIKG